MKKKESTLSFAVRKRMGSNIILSQKKVVSLIDVAEKITPRPATQELFPETAFESTSTITWS